MRRHNEGTAGTVQRRRSPRDAGFPSDSQRDSDVQHRPDPRQMTLGWGIPTDPAGKAIPKRRPAADIARVRDRLGRPPVRKPRPEVAPVEAATPAIAVEAPAEPNSAADIPPHWLVIAERMARAKAVEACLDEFGLRSAALWALVECVRSPEMQAGTIEVPDAWAAGFVRNALRREVNRQRRSRWSRRMAVRDPYVMQQTQADRADHEPLPEADGFWRYVEDRLTATQFGTVVRLYREGMTGREIAEQDGVSESSIFKRMEQVRDRLGRLLWGEVFVAAAMNAWKAVPR